MFIIAVLGRSSNLQDTKDLRSALKVEHDIGNLGNKKAKLPGNCYGSSDIDVLLSGLYQVPVLTFQHCSNGGGVALLAWYGLEHYDKSKFCCSADKDSIVAIDTDSIVDYAHFEMKLLMSY